MNDISTLTKISNPFSLEKVSFPIKKRFQNDYEVVQVLEKGEISTLYKVRNLLDNSFYAIKEISIKVTKSNKETVQQEIENVLKEVRLLARLKNEYVVNYNHSWIEVKFKQTKEITESVENLAEESLARMDSTKDEIPEKSADYTNNSTSRICLNDIEYKYSCF